MKIRQKIQARKRDKKRQNSDKKQAYSGQNSDKKPILQDKTGLIWD
jgi:hypothetical protein